MALLGVVAVSAQPAAAQDETAELRLLLAAERQRITHLETALRTTVVIEQAKGVLGERFRIDLDEAFALLREAARSHRLKIHDLAYQVVNEWGTPSAILTTITRRRMSLPRPGNDVSSDGWQQ